MWRGFLLLASLVACAEPKTNFQCTGNASCRNGGTTGICEETGFCSFPDDACDSGQRYGASAGDALANACVDYGPDPLGTWGETDALPTVSHTHATVVADEKLYVIGGILGSTMRPQVFVGAVDTNPIGVEKTLQGRWSTTTPLPEARRNHGAAVVDGHVYVLGGRSGSDNATDNVYSAPIGADGSIGAWMPTMAVPDPVRCAPVVASGRFLYVVGGKYGDAPTNRVLVATTSNGEITEWRLAGQLPRAVSCPAVVMHGARMLVIGGCGAGGTACSNILSNVWVTEVATDGTLGPFVETQPLPAPRWDHAAVIAKDHVYVLAGYAPPKTLTTEVWSAHVNRDGSLGKWRTSSPLNEGRWRPSAAVVGDFVFVIHTTTQVAPLN